MLWNKKGDLRGSWPQAIASLLLPLLAIFTVRWAIVEPFVIPSGSMIPTLLINDHIFANKLSFGLHLPFSKAWIFKWNSPKRGDIVVFRYPPNPEIYFVKRVVAVSGDKISMQSGQLYINDEPLAQQEVQDPQVPDDGFAYYQEGGHLVRYLQKDAAEFALTLVPEGHFFVMGDNRDQSSDSRFWGFVPEDNLVGKPVMIWLSCTQKLPNAPFLCDPSSIRWERLFQVLL